MKPIVIVGYRGRMPQSVAHVLRESKRPFLFSSEHAPAAEKSQKLENTLGVIDFTSPERSKKVLSEAVQAKVPYVCGTTGWTESIDKIFAEAAKKIPVFYAANFSIGIELLGRALESLGNLKDHKVYLTDIHHKHKKDSPSGTAKKLTERMKAITSNLSLEHRDYRIGENPGEHQIQIDLGEETLCFAHRSFNNHVYSRGSMKALDWLQDKPAGFYSMKDLLS